MKHRHAPRAWPSQGLVDFTWAVNREMHFPFGRVLQIQSHGAYLRQAGMARSFATRFVERFAFS